MIDSVYVSDSNRQGKKFKISTCTNMDQLDSKSQNNDLVFNITDTNSLLIDRIYINKVRK